MGLVLNCGQIRVSLGYPDIHVLRGEAARAMIFAIRADEPESDSAIEAMRRASAVICWEWDFPLFFRTRDGWPDAIEPDYEFVPIDIPADLSSQTLNALSGLNWFIRHSDADGFHSTGQCQDIHTMLVMIREHVRPQYRSKFAELMELYQSRGPVFFL